MDNKLLPIGKTAKLLGVSIDTLRRWDKSGKFSSVRISAGGNRYYRKSEIDLFINEPLSVALNWAISDKTYEPDQKYYCKTRDVFQVRLEHMLAELLGENSKAFSSLISAVAGEIGNNSFDHNIGNWPDVLGIYFSYSLTERKIVLADRGLGILFTLKRVRPDLKSHKDSLKVAFTEIISGRAPESRGNGLKFVRNIVTQNPIRLTFQSGDALLKLQQGKQDIDVENSERYMRGCLAVIEF
ncbi:hypothetical protein COX03_02785 [Candidatus Woesebacteria bacterium CG22_combo_CG10-13_8_21_14_all_39_10]|uniref:HTH merR-type domain-containing protein n=2 Tax=Candidatus Woeseibacteriota TaxID=1752722 RepID=A0A2M7AQT3_9BACT|nr:MAG: hypothetical protein COX03_02785 [Candidatus Woesebacteria bacterium CG22_combo_CG10-13_8_21_14_all_39_10]PIU72000.1 MAG: hypothetical protein COS80_00170 [Candidatus Woesebacteria bacterium CG06_land_8_20_14_3_00_39_27]